MAWLLNVGFVSQDAVDSESANAAEFSQVLAADNASGIDAADDCGLSIGECCVPIILPWLRSMASAIHHVRCVIRWRPIVKMLGIHASASIAFMKNARLPWFTELSNKCEPVSFHGLPRGDLERAISIGVARPHPQPAAMWPCRLIDIAIKSFFRRQSTQREASDGIAVPPPSVVMSLTPPSRQCSTLAPCNATEYWRPKTRMPTHVPSLAQSAMG